jgi:hypothetical protein
MSLTVSNHLLWLSKKLTMVRSQQLMDLDYKTVGSRGIACRGSAPERLGILQPAHLTTSLPSRVLALVCLSMVCQRIVLLFTASLTVRPNFRHWHYCTGTANCSYGISLDGNETSLRSPVSGNTLFTSGTLSTSQHTLVITANPDSGSQQLAIDEAVISASPLDK